MIFSIELVLADDDQNKLYCTYNNNAFFSIQCYDNASACSFEASEAQDTRLIDYLNNSNFPSEGLSNSTTQKWWKDNGLVDSSGNVSCPTNPFGISKWRR